MSPEARDPKIINPETRARIVQLERAFFKQQRIHRAWVHYDASDEQNIEASETLKREFIETVIRIQVGEIDEIPLTTQPSPAPVVGDLLIVDLPIITPALRDFPLRISFGIAELEGIEPNIRVLLPETV